MSEAVKVALIQAYTGLLKKGEGNESGMVEPNLRMLHEIAHEAHRRALKRGGVALITARDVSSRNQTASVEKAICSIDGGAIAEALRSYLRAARAPTARPPAQPWGGDVAATGAG